MEQIVAVLFTLACAVAVPLPAQDVQHPLYPAQNPAFPARTLLYPAQSPQYPAQNPLYPALPPADQHPPPMSQSDSADLVSFLMQHPELLDSSRYPVVDSAYSAQQQLADEQLYEDPFVTGSEDGTLFGSYPDTPAKMPSLDAYGYEDSLQQEPSFADVYNRNDYFDEPDFWSLAKKSAGGDDIPMSDDELVDEIDGLRQDMEKKAAAAKTTSSTTTTTTPRSTSSTSTSTTTTTTTTTTTPVPQRISKPGAGTRGGMAEVPLYRPPSHHPVNAGQVRSQGPQATDTQPTESAYDTIKRFLVMEDALRQLSKTSGKSRKTKRFVSDQYSQQLENMRTVRT